MRAILATLLLLVFQLGFSQSPFRFQRYGTKEGLANEYVWGIEQDSLGFIWISWFDKLSRFDGYTFKVYQYKPDDSLRSRLDFNIGRPMRDSHDNIWVPDHKEKPGLEYLARYDRVTDGFIKYTADLGIAYVHQRIIEKDGSRVWFATESRGLFSYDFKTGATVNHLNLAPDGKSQEPYSIASMKDEGNELLLATDAGLWRFDKTTKSFSRPTTSAQDSMLLYQSPVHGILESKNFNDGFTWLRIQRSLVKIDSNFRVVQKYIFPDVLSMDQWARDSDGVFWLGSAWGRQDGLFRYDPKDNSLVQIKHDPEDALSLPDNSINDVLVDSEQNVWVTTDRGLAVLRKKDLTFYNIRVPEGNIWANTVLKTQESDYLVLRNEPSSSNKFLMSVIDPGKPGVIKFEPILDKIDEFAGWAHKGKNTFWVSAQRNGIIGYPINKRTGLMESPPKHLRQDPQNPSTLRSNVNWGLYEDAREDLWISTPFGVDRVRSDIPFGSPGSVTHYEKWGNATGMFPENATSFWMLIQHEVLLVHLPAARGDSARLERMFEFKEAVTVLFTASNGELYLGTKNGLYALIKERDHYTVNHEPLLYGYVVNSIQEDSNGRFWIDSEVKLICYDPKYKTITTFDEGDGIEHFRSLRAGRMHRLSSGMMLVVDMKGVSIFDPLSFQLNRRNVVPVLTRLEVNNKAVTGRILPGDSDFSTQADIGVLSELVLDYTHNDFTIEFSAMELAAPEKNRYRHKLDGYNRDWIEGDSKNRMATYTNLDAGTYTFRVMSTNHNGLWGTGEKTLRIVILPPPWKTAWAYTGYGLLFVGLLFAARRNIVQRERLKSNLVLAKVEQDKEHFELEKAREVDRVKTSFFTNISHEFRTPLTLIKGPVQNLLERFRQDTEITQKLKMVQRNSDVLLKLINQLLDLAKLDAGNLKVTKSDGALNSFINAVASSFSSFAAQKNVALTIDLPRQQYRARFDKDKLETILINLVNNAIKFTPMGGKVIVTASIETEQLRLSVRDTGIGIPENHQKRIFERFHQVSEAHKEVGTGIGLSLVKDLVALLEGTIEVSSKTGEGSEFLVALPLENIRLLEHDETEEVAPQEPEILMPLTRKNGSGELDETASSKPSILVVEDNDDLRAYIIDCLGNEFSFHEAGNGIQGIKVATSEVPDFIISDVMMPEMDGITMAVNLKSNKLTNHIPLIILTAKSTEESMLAGLGTGAVDYLTKPFNKNELLLKVRNTIVIRSRMREKMRIELMSAAPKVEVLSEDEQFLIKVKESILGRLSDEQLNVESLADDLGMSRTQLYRKISALTGLSAVELLRSLRLHRAAQLLEQNWAPVSQVAYEVGFSNLSYFSKVFKEEHGVLPSEYAASKSK